MSLKYKCAVCQTPTSARLFDMCTSCEYAYSELLKRDPTYREVLLWGITQTWKAARKHRYPCSCGRVLSGKGCAPHAKRRTL